MDRQVEWLLDGPPWVRYNARTRLLGHGESQPDVLADRRAMLAHDQVQLLIGGLAEWPLPPLKRHNDASHALHKLSFLADLGVRADDTGMRPVVDRILAHRSEEGPFQSLLEVAVAFGGTGVAQPLWALCDAPTVAYALVKMGLAEDERVQAAVVHMTGRVRDNGWPCAASPQLGTFHGPGRRSDPCPYATLVMLKLLAELPQWRDGVAARTGAESLLRLWQARREQRPYLFAMGSDFCKLKAPLIWYDILHVVAVLGQFPRLRDDVRLREMAGIVSAKADDRGRFTPESVYRAWAEWDFGQKRSPSMWLTVLAQQALGRMQSQASA